MDSPTPAPEPHSGHAETTSAGGKPAQLVEHFFRHETGRLHGALIRLMGVEHMALAEDIAQEALLKAMHCWSMGGVPANPSAWIMRVAINLARDALRHRRMSGAKETSISTHFEQMMPASLAASDVIAAAETEGEIRDDTLRLIFVCCHPEIAPDAQVVLALKLLCGFSTAEIARAFFSSDAAIDKQLTRTKQRIRDLGIRFEIPAAGTELRARLDGVLATLYLLFNEGYKASAGDRLLREDLCQEAVRLLTLLVKHPAGNTPRAHALLSLMLLTAARFPSRLDEQGDLLRLDDQDRSKWHQRLIEAGLQHLALAAEGTEVTEYHLQAGIAAIHCLSPSVAQTDWRRILLHYDELYRLKPSPLVALNRAVALAHVEGPQAALDALDRIPQRERLDAHYLLHAVSGELHWRMKNFAAAAQCFRRALTLAHVGPEQIYLSRMLERAAGPADPGQN